MAKRTVFSAMLIACATAASGCASNFQAARFYSGTPMAPSQVAILTSGNFPNGEMQSIMPRQQLTVKLDIAKLDTYGDATIDMLATWRGQNRTSFWFGTVGELLPGKYRVCVSFRGQLCGRQGDSVGCEAVEIDAKPGHVYFLDVLAIPDEKNPVLCDKWKPIVDDLATDADYSNDYLRAVRRRVDEYLKGERPLFTPAGP